MGFKKQDLVSDISVTLTYPNLYKAENGTPIKFEFTFRRQKQAESDKAELENTTTLDTFSRLLKTEPIGFDDFPRDERSLEIRVKEYFAGEDMKDFVFHSMERYWRFALPAEFFRSI